MAKHIALGKKGEDLAAVFLQRKGYEILHRNWRTGHLEIDIIAQIGNEIVFVEVKTRATAAYGFPEEAVSKAKAQKLFKAADAFIIQENIDNEIRFDIISILLKGGLENIYHIEDGISPFPLL